MLSLPRFFTTITLALCCTFAGIIHAKSADHQALINAVNHYQQEVQAGNLALAASKAHTAYQLATKLLPAENKSLQTIADDYAYLLIKTGKNEQALPVLQQLLATKEQQVGKHAKALIPVLKSLTTASKSDKDLQQSYSLRYQKLALRHYSDQYVAKYEEQPLASTQQAENLAGKLRRLTGKNYQVTNGGKWDFIYNLDNDRDFSPTLTQMELSYRSALGFLFAFNILSKPAEDKFKAVFFDSRDDYLTYLHDFRSINRSEAAQWSAGIYLRDQKSLFLFARNGKNKKRNAHNEHNIMRHEIAHQLFFELGLHVQGVVYPRWLKEGLATSLEFQHPNKISGPQTDNLNRYRLLHYNKLKQAGKILPLQKLVSLWGGYEYDASSNSDIYLTSGLLVRYLYQHHPDKFRNYIAAFSRRATDSSGKRLAIFSRHFGKPEELQPSFDQFVAKLTKAKNKARQTAKS